MNRNQSRILDSWSANAGEWISLIDSGGIASRKYTNAAILEALLTFPGKRLVDLGCGEGWLARSLAEEGKEMMGIDGTSTLIDRAKALGLATYHCMAYETIIAGGTPPVAPFDGAVFNFSLYERPLLVPLLTRIAEWIPTGRLFIQTLHPFSLIGKGMPYGDQTLENAWDGLPGQFERPHTYDVLTFSGWVAAFEQTPWKLVAVNETMGHPPTVPLSIIFILSHGE